MAFHARRFLRRGAVARRPAAGAWAVLASAVSLVAAVGASCAQAQSPASVEGIGLSPPSGWVLQAPDGEQVVLQGPDGISFIAVVLQQGALTSLLEPLTHPLPAPPADLLPLRPAQREGNRVANSFIASGLGPLSRAVVAGQAAPAGRILLAYGFTEPGKEAELSATIAALLDGARLPAFPAPPSSTQAGAGALEVPRGGSRPGGEAPQAPTLDAGEGAP
jgi:hypothetical protein